MRYYVKGRRRAGLMLFRRGNDADYAKVDRIDRHNLSVAESVYDAIMSGRIDYAYIRNGSRLLVYTRSLRGSFVQVSYFYDLVPSMHTDLHTAKDLSRTLIPCKHINLKTA